MTEAPKCFLSIIEGMLLVSDDLVCFVAFSGNEYDVSRSGRPRGPLDGLATVDDAGSFRGVTHASPDVIDDGLRFLITRIITGHNHSVGVLLGDRAHHSAFGYVTISAASEHTPDLLLRLPGLANRP